MPSKKIGAMRNLKSRKLYLQVYDELRDYIAQNKLQPGDRLPTEMEMCQLLGVSRNVLREAIKTMEISGMVSSKPGVGIIIQEFSPDFLFQSLFYNLTGDSELLLDQSLAVRRMLELGFLKDAFDSLAPSDLELLQQQLDIMDKVCRETKQKRSAIAVFGHEFYQADANFHKILYSKIENVFLTAIIDAVWVCDKHHKERIQSSYIEKTVEKHMRIVKALKEQDFLQFSDAMHYHFDVFYKAKYDEAENGENKSRPPSEGKPLQQTYAVE